MSDRTRRTRRRGLSVEDFEDHAKDEKADIVDISAASETLVWLGPWSKVIGFVGTVFLPTGPDDFIFYRCDEDPYSLKYANRKTFEAKTDRYMGWHVELCQSDLDNDTVVYSVGKGRKAVDYMLRDMRVGQEGGNYRMNLRPQLRYLVNGVGEDGKLRIYRMAPTAGEKMLGVSSTRKKHKGKDKGDFRNLPYAVEFKYDKTASPAKQYDCNFVTDSDDDWPRGMERYMDMPEDKLPDPTFFCEPTKNLRQVREQLIEGMENAIGDDADILKALDADSCEAFVDRFFNPDELPEDDDTSFDTEALDKENEWDGDSDDGDDDSPQHEDDADDDPEPEQEAEPAERRSGRNRRSTKSEKKETRSSRALGSDKRNGGGKSQRRGGGRNKRGGTARGRRSQSDIPFES